MNSDTLHFCWLVDPWKVSREQYIRAWQDAGWSCVLWHCGQMPDLPELPGVKLENALELIRGSLVDDAFTYELKHHSHAACADLFRYQVIYSLGGTYSDIDVLPGPNAKPSLPFDRPIFGQAYQENRLEIRFIRSAPKQPLLRDIITAVLKNQRIFERRGGYARKYSDIPARTGPVAAQIVVGAFAKRQGQTLSDYVLTDATMDETWENRSEGHGLRVKEIMSRAERVQWWDENTWKLRR